MDTSPSRSAMSQVAIEDGRPLEGASGSGSNGTRRVVRLLDQGNRRPTATAAAEVAMSPPLSPASASDAAPLADEDGASAQDASSRSERFPNTITVIVKTMDTRDHAICCSADATVLELKQAVCLTVNVEPGRQRLIHLGKPMKPDHEKISHFGVTDGKAIHLVVREEVDSDASDDRAPSEHSSRGLLQVSGGTSAGRPFFQAPLRMDTDLSDVFRSMSAGPAIGAPISSTTAGGSASVFPVGRMPNRPQDSSTLYITGNGVSSCTLFPRSRGNQFFTRAVPLARLHGPTTETTPQVQMARIRASLRNVDTLLGHLTELTPPELHLLTLPAVADPPWRDMAEFDPANVDQISALMRLTEGVAQMEVRVAEALREVIPTLRAGVTDRVQRPPESSRRIAIITGNISYRMSQIHLLLTTLIMNLQFRDGDAETHIAVPAAELPRRLRPHASSAHAGQPDTLFGHAPLVSGSGNSTTRRSRGGRMSNGGPFASGQSGGSLAGFGLPSSMFAPETNGDPVTGAHIASNLSMGGGRAPSATRPFQPAASAPSSTRAGPSLISMELSVGISDGPLSGSSQPQSSNSTTIGETGVQQERQSGPPTSASSGSGQSGRESSGNDSQSHQAVFHFTIHSPQLQFMSATRNPPSANLTTSQELPNSQPFFPAASTNVENSAANNVQPPPSPRRARTPPRVAPSASLDEFPYIPMGLRFTDLMPRGSDRGAVPQVSTDPVIRSYAESHPLNGTSTLNPPGPSEESVAVNTPDATTGPGTAAATGSFAEDYSPFRWPPGADDNSRQSSRQPLEALRDADGAPGASGGSVPSLLSAAGESASGSSRKRRRDGREGEAEGRA